MSRWAGIAAAAHVGRGTYLSSPLPPGGARSGVEWSLLGHGGGVWSRRTAAGRSGYRGGRRHRSADGYEGVSTSHGRAAISIEHSNQWPGQVAGYDWDEPSMTLQPGDTFTLTLYYRATQATSGDYKRF